MSTDFVLEEYRAEWLKAGLSPGQRAELESYHKGTYASTARRIGLCMRHQYKPCIAGLNGMDEDGDACEPGFTCKRHERTGEVVERYLRRFG